MQSIKLETMPMDSMIIWESKREWSPIDNNRRTRAIIVTYPINSRKFFA